MGNDERERHVSGPGELVLRARRDDADAWAALVERYTGMLWSIARSYDLSAADSGDVIQTAWLRLVERLHLLRKPDSGVAWLGYVRSWAETWGETWAEATPDDRRRDAARPDRSGVRRARPGTRPGPRGGAGGLRHPPALGRARRAVRRLGRWSPGRHRRPWAARSPAPGLHRPRHHGGDRGDGRRRGLGARRATGPARARGPRRPPSQRRGDGTRRPSRSFHRPRRARRTGQLGIRVVRRVVDRDELGPGVSANAA